jgi:two-component system sensor histidine kinase ChiS
MMLPNTGIVRRCYLVSLCCLAHILAPALASAQDQARGQALGKRFLREQSTQIQGTLYGNSVPKILRFQHLGSEQGLPQNSVRCIVQDRLGYVWFGTEDGLARFDGYSFLVFRHDPQDSTTLANSYISKLYEDRSGTLWVGTNGGGLNRFDRASGKFTHYKNNPNDSTSLSDNNIRSMLEDSVGDFWVGTRGGLNRFNRSTGTATRYMHSPNVASSLRSNTVRVIVEDSFGILWVGSDGGLSRFDRATGQFTHYQRDSTNPQSLGNNIVLSIIEERDQTEYYNGKKGGALWVGTWGGGLHRFNRARGTFTQYRHNAADSSTISNDIVWSLLEDHHMGRFSGGRLWAGTWGGGLNYVDRTTGQFTRFQPNPAEAKSLSNNLVLSLLEDRAGEIWVGTGNGGVNRFDPKTEAFLSYQNKFDNPKSLGNNVVRSLLEDHTGAVWVGTSNGLYRLDKATGNFTAFHHDPTQKGSISDNIIWCLLEDRAGNIWAGTEVGGLNRFDRATGKFTHYSHSEADKTSLNNNDVRAIMEDHLGMIWVGTLWSGLDCFNPATGTFQHFKHDPNDKTSLSNNTIRALLEDRSGTVWAGTGTVGLNRYNRTTGKFTRFVHNPSVSTSLSNNIVRCLLEDRRGTLWVGTHGGLNRFDAATGTFTVFTEQDGLPNNVIYGILDDEQGNLWLSTNKGLCRFNPKRRTVTNFDKRDGLQDNEFNGGAYSRGRGGRMYFGGINGFNEFRPATITTDTVPPPILLTMFRKFNRPASLDSAVEVKKVITLPYNENSIGFEFVAMSFRNAERNLYSYKLDGFDKDWSIAGTERKATYTNLEPGEYVFRVRGSNSDQLWNMSGATVQIRILPPWWRTWWAYSLYTLGGVALFTLLSILVQRRRIRHLRERQKAREDELMRRSNAKLTAANDEIMRQQQLVLRQNEHLQELNKEKSEVLDIVAHDLKSPLSGVRNLAALMEEYAESLAKDDITRYAGMIHQSSTRMFQIVRSLLDVNTLEQGGMKAFFEEIDCAEMLRPLVAEYQERAAKKSLTLHYEEPVNITVFADERLLQQVVDNLLSNAVKYSPPNKRVWLTVEKRGGAGIQSESGSTEVVQISVRDEGQGFREAEKDKLFGKFARLSAQPTGGEHSTGLGLSIVKKMVEAMNGKVWCESEFGKGATFIVELPSAED